VPDATVPEGGVPEGGVPEGGVLGEAGTWLVVVDMQHVFADAASPWAAPRFAEIVEPVRDLAMAAGERTIWTRFVAPEVPTGSWADYYRRWPLALLPPDSSEYGIVDELASLPGVRIDATTFGKWTPEMSARAGDGSHLVVCGVSTDCCVLSTVLAAADAGQHVEVVADACAGVDDASHGRALAILALYAPIVEVVGVADVLGRV